MGLQLLGCLLCVLTFSGVVLFSEGGSERYVTKSDAFLGPQDVLSRNLQFRALDIGPAPCKFVAPPGSGSFKYTVPRKSRPSDKAYAVPASNFAINRIDCKGGKNAAVVFYNHVEDPARNDPTIFALVVRRMLYYIASKDNTLKILVGSAVRGADPVQPGDAPSCRYSRKSSESLNVRNIIFMNSSSELRLPTPDPRQFFHVIPGNLYALVNFDLSVPDGNGSICLYTDNAVSNPKESDQFSSEDDRSSHRSLSSGQVIGIIVGVVGVLLAILVVLTGGYYWMTHFDASESISVDAVSVAGSIHSSYVLS